MKFDSFSIRQSRMICKRKFFLTKVRHLNVYLSNDLYLFYQKLCIAIALEADCLLGPETTQTRLHKVSKELLFNGVKTIFALDFPSQYSGARLKEKTAGNK